MELDINIKDDGGAPAQQDGTLGDALVSAVKAAAPPSQGPLVTDQQQQDQPPADQPDADGGDVNVDIGNQQPAAPAQDQPQAGQQAADDQQQPQPPQQDQQPALPPLLQRLQEDEELRLLVGAYVAEGDPAAAHVVRMAQKVDEMDALSVIRQAVAIEHPDADSDVLDAMVQVRLRNEGVSDEMDEQMQQRMLQVIARQYRDKIKQRAAVLQQKIEETMGQMLEGAAAPAQQQAVPEEVQQIVARVKAHIEGSPVTSLLREHKAVTLRVNGKEVRLPVEDADEVVRAPLEGFVPLLQHAVDEQGMPDMTKLALAMSLLRDPARFIKHLVGVGRTLTLEELAADKGDGPRAQEPQGTPAKAQDDIQSLVEAINRARRG
ncbi:MAG: hypothetical protein D6717_01420 [Gammaproteobacteria bacterium]|nr:MAG: hypothetical protein D6717_01420 [Gammaproteobacteria bacterium]